MLDKVDVLAIDDDSFVQRMITRALESGGLSPRTASDGESGIAEAHRVVPDIILLDVEMPGISGYEACEQLKTDPVTADVPVVFLSSHSSLRERMQGYEVGADDYLVKPFEPEHLLARIRVLLKYREERQELQQQYELAQKTAMQALTGTSELGYAMHFLEHSLGFQTFEETARGFFEATDRLSLDCILLLNNGDEIDWYASQGSISPLERELVEMSDPEARFTDFGVRTIVSYPNVRLLIKNMPLDDMARYGRIKDLLPILLSAVNTKINVLTTQEALTHQSQALMQSLNRIRGSLYHLASTILKNRNATNQLMSVLVQDLQEDLLRMGLEEDQEDYLINRIDSAINEALEEMDAGAELRGVFTFILDSLKEIVHQHQDLLDEFIAHQAEESVDSDSGGDIELF